ncbi:MAG: OmpH family outer membrane protein [Flavobacteriales bacterium]
MLADFFYLSQPRKKISFKRVLIVLGILVFIGSNHAFSQRFAYVDTDYILKHIPEYKEAQKKLNKLSKRWQKKIEKKQKEIDRMYRSLKAEKILLTDKMIEKRKKKIKEEERKLSKFKTAHFGKNGKLFKKRKELLAPIQDEIYSAVKKLADDKNYAIIFDKAEKSNILYTSERYDKTEDIIEDLGYEPGKKVGDKKGDKKKEK